MSDQNLSRLSPPEPDPYLPKRARWKSIGKKFALTLLGGAYSLAALFFIVVVQFQHIQPTEFDKESMWLELAVAFIPVGLSLFFDGFRCFALGAFLAPLLVALFLFIAICVICGNFHYG